MRRFAVSMTGGLAAAIAGAGVLAAERVMTVETDDGSVAVEQMTDGLVHPWGMAYMADGRVLVTERPGRLRVLGTDGELSEPLEGAPQVFARRQGGLLDVALDPDYEENRHVWLSFAEPGEGGASTALGRGRFAEDRLEDFEVVFRQEPKLGGATHFGSRIVFRPDGTLLLTLGERFEFDPAQDLSNHLGTIVRIERDGSVPEDNPFLDDPDAKPEIWSYGHRNIQAAALHPETGELYIGEMGPRGGDELNLVRAGNNHGWPEVSWGDHYIGGEIPDPPTRPEFAHPLMYWTPAIAPSGMTFYTADMFPAWQGSALIGGLQSRGIVRVDIDGEKAEEVERVELGVRIRDVHQAPDGSVWVLTDRQNGYIWRLRPVE